MFDTVIRTDFIDSKSLSILREYCDVCEYYINESYGGLPDANPDNCSFTDKMLLEMGLPPAPKEILRSHRTSDMVEEIRAILSKTYSACDEMIFEIYKKRMLSFQGGGIIRYQPGQSLPYHKDWTVGDKWVVERNLPTVHLSSVFYINDDYKGGELKMSSQRFGDFRHDVMSLKPPAGSIIFFDALQWHASAPVKSGNKYSNTNFYTLQDM
jgi:predicted 2-oxoglutarate/Fe(II)-dependent dioxygenase YbiX